MTNHAARAAKAERTRLGRVLREAQHHLRPLEHRLTEACQEFQVSGGRDKTPILSALDKLEQRLKHEAQHVHRTPVSSASAERARNLATNALHLFAAGVSDLDKAWVTSDSGAAQHLAARAAGHSKHAQRLQRRAAHVLGIPWKP